MVFLCLDAAFDADTKLDALYSRSPPYVYREYKKQFNIPAKYSLVATVYSESRKQAAIDRGLGENLAKARAARAEKKAGVPAVKGKAPVPVVKKKAAVPAVI